MTIVEVLSRSGRVAHRVRLERLPATIGRGYGNDVILDDPYADAVHAKLLSAETGGLVVEDLGSVNGLFAGEATGRVAAIVLAPGATFRVGHTTLRVATPELAVAPALKDPAAGSPLAQTVYSRRTAALATLVGAPLCALSFFLGGTEAAGGGAFARNLVATILSVAAWAGLWALGTRLAIGRARFAAHLVVAWVVITIAIALMTLDEWTGYLLAGKGSGDVLAALLGAAMVIVLIYGHLGVASRLNPKRRVLVGGITLAVLAGFAALVPEESAFETEAISIGTVLKPAPSWLVRTAEPAAFLERVTALQEKLDDAADAQR